MSIKTILVVVGDVKVVRLKDIIHPSEDDLFRRIGEENKKREFDALGFSKTICLHGGTAVLMTHIVGKSKKK